MAPTSDTSYRWLRLPRFATLIQPNVNRDLGENGRTRLTPALAGDSIAGVARRCSVCKHPRSAEIDAALINASVSQASIAKDFHFNLRSLERHLAKHVRGNGSQALAIQRQVNRDLGENGRTRLTPALAGD